MDLSALSLDELLDAYERNPEIAHEMTVNQRLSLVWPLTVREWKRRDPNFDPNARMRRDIVRIYRMHEDA